MNFCIILALLIMVAVSALPQNKIRPLMPHSIASSSRIVGGSPAELGQFPYQTAITYQSGVVTGFCGGSLISADWVLTTASCASQSAISFTIDLGIIDLQTPNVQVGALEAIVHPDFDGTMSHDIALIHLDTTVEFNANIAPVALNSAYIGSGQNAIASGWGFTSDSSPGLSQFLNWVVLQTMDNAECRTFYGDFIVDGMICCTSQGPVKATCYGDKGCPLVIGEGAAAQHIGIASFVDSAGCESGYPSGFTRTSFYRDWITEVSGI